MWRRSKGIYVHCSSELVSSTVSSCSQHGRTKSERMLWPMAGLKLGDDMVVVGSALYVIEVDLIPMRIHASCTLGAAEGRSESTPATCWAKFTKDVSLTLKNCCHDMYLNFSAPAIFIDPFL